MLFVVKSIRYMRAEHAWILFALNSSRNKDDWKSFTVCGFEDGI